MGAVDGAATVDVAVEGAAAIVEAMDDAAAVNMGDNEDDGMQTTRTTACKTTRTLISRAYLSLRAFSGGYL